MENPKEELKYPIGGYAPGYYMCNCSTCKKQFQGDKRAVQCEPCAIEMIKEEPKQETLENPYLFTPKPLIDISRMKLDNHPDLHKQETLEEAAEKHSKEMFSKNGDLNAIAHTSFIKGAKWQQERSYSEEEVRKMLEDAVHESRMQDDKSEDYIVNETIFEFKKK